ncbi:zinc-binding alcohol dehydrogenase family protein [Blastococcus goldschmidtiae]|uniref:Zinc-binding alcohol dehydrogenase family protein n=1 Tax=Blastococcus goldschmidtiae TaxID=3075546 RepID=A0ABU2K599_9ACTN|nr:zinc-binding alcohol dehydrogenase family protein [Blastococcus sp. DSM 46792]MDT0275377.1 zinc-binding alcohol dehydrogenase family protein [Blastococcus sp. DSM 46792]
MRAAVVSTPGETPELVEHPEPTSGAGEAVVRVSAAPLVPLDLLCASGTSYFGRPATPYVPGVQGVGVVESSPDLAPGTRVWFATSAGMAPGDGSLAERCAVRADDVVPVDADVPDAALAALGLSAVAAWMSLTWRGGLRPGEHVLVLGAGGAVGQVAVGAARVLGAGQVVAVARSAAARERARAAGADQVLPLDGDADVLTDRFREALGGRLDLVIDPVFGTAATAASRVLSDGGRLVNLGGASGDLAEFSSAVLRARSASVLGYTNNALTPARRREALMTVAGHAAGGRLAVAHEEVPLADVAAAWRRQATGDPGVRLVLTP